MGNCFKKKAPKAPEPKPTEKESMYIKKLKGMSEFQNTIENGEKGRVLVLEIFATWCGPCNQIAPVYEDIAKELSREVGFFKMDVDENEEVANALEVSQMPTFIAFKDGEKLGMFSGSDRDRVREFIESNKA